MIQILNDLEVFDEVGAELPRLHDGKWHMKNDGAFCLPQSLNVQGLIKQVLTRVSQA